MPLRRFTLLVVSLAAGGVLAGASPAGAGIVREPVPGSTGASFQAAMASNAAGTVAVVASGRRGLVLTRSVGGKRFGRPIRLGRSLERYDDTGLQVAVGTDGSVLVVWARNDHSVPADVYSRDDDCCYRMEA